jgi:hypothetical protein
MLKKIISSLKNFIILIWSKVIYLEILFYRNILKKNMEIDITLVKLLKD